MTMQLISTVAVDGSASATFSSIPATFTDLMITCSLRDNGTGTNHYFTLTFNGSTADYSGINLYGNGSSADWSSGGSGTLERFVTGSGATANTFSSIQIYVPNYASSSQKPYSYEGVSENNSSAVFLTIGTGLWANTSAISSFTIQTNSGSFVVGSTVSIYGITKGSGGATVA